jgi:RPA family protein
MVEKNNYFRQPAIKTTIGEIASGKYVQESEDKSNYVLTSKNIKIYRLNLIAIILSKELQGSITNLLVDDGTGKITLKSFEENKNLSDINVGNVVLIIGKLRTYNQDKYISPEIIKKIDPQWLKIRAIELKDNFIKNDKNINLKQEEKETIKIIEEKQEFKDEKEIKKEKEINPVDIEEDLPIQKIIKIIKELDNGDGVFIEELIEKSTLNETEKLIQNMLENGDIFQNYPGKVKVL